MDDLTFYSELGYAAHLAAPFESMPDVWCWAPNLLHWPLNLDNIEKLSATGYERIGTRQIYWQALYMLASQLSDIRIVDPANSTEGEQEIWIPSAEKTRLEFLPVILAFPPSRGEWTASGGKRIDARRIRPQRALPPAGLGQIGLVLAGEGDSARWRRYSIHNLDQQSQQLQQSLSASLDKLNKLASARNLTGPAFLDQWKELQDMARRLATAYWRAYENSQVERPKPINIWTLRQGEAALAAMTMIQDGAHAAIYHKDKWEKEHMIEQGNHQGLMVNRYIHTHGKRKENSTEFWMQHPMGAEDIPNDPELVTKELMRYQAKLDDPNCDLSMLVPIYPLATQQEEVYISPEQLLKDSDFAPKLNHAGYGKTYEPNEVQRIIDAFENMARFNLKTRQWMGASRRGVKAHLITAESPYLVITERIYQEPLELGGPRKFLGWKYQVPWLSAFTSGDTEAGKQLGVLLKKSFAYSQKQRWEKRLARYLTIHLNVAAHKGQSSINCDIRNVLEQCGLAPTDRDRRLPGEYAQQFEDAMYNLRRDGIIGDWLPKINRQTDLPARGWLDLWLDSSFRVTQAPTALQAGYQKMIDERKPHKGTEGA